MTKRIKSGQELLDEFFSGLKEFCKADQNTAEIISRLYNDGKLTVTNISNELKSAREAESSGETEQN